MLNPKLSFFTKNGFLIQEEQIAKNSNGYAVLATIDNDIKMTKHSFAKLSINKNVPVFPRMTC